MLSGMRPNRPLAGVLALGSIVIAVAAEILAVRNVAGPLGIVLLAVAGLTAVAAWLALGAPRTRADIARAEG